MFYLEVVCFVASSSNILELEDRFELHVLLTSIIVEYRTVVKALLITV